MPYSARWQGSRGLATRRGIIGPVGRGFGMRQVCRIVVALAALLGGAASAQATDCEEEHGEDLQSQEAAPASDSACSR